MPKFILRFETKRGPRYLEYSTVVDAPVTWGMTLRDFKRYYKERYGTEGMRELPERLAKADKHGSSFYGYGQETLAESILCNRAGAGETEMTMEEMRDYYCIKRKGKKPRGSVKREDEVPTRIVVDDETLDKICEEIDNPRPPTEAMRRLFEPAGLTDDEIRGVLHDQPVSGDPTGLDAYLDPSVGLSKAEYAEWEDRICGIDGYRCCGGVDGHKTFCQSTARRLAATGTFDPAERAREKQASRDADAQVLADGTKTREQLRRENASFAFPRDRVKLTPPKRER